LPHRRKPPEEEEENEDEDDFRNPQSMMTAVALRAQ
jgi:hypothetical protein